LFVCPTDFLPPVCAADVVHAVTALLTCPKHATMSSSSSSSHVAGGSPSGGAGAGNAGDGGGDAVPASALTTVATTWRQCFDEAYRALARYVCCVASCCVLSRHVVF
jgi:hypothetical protein